MWDVIISPDMASIMTGFNSKGEEIKHTRSSGTLNAAIRGVIRVLFAASVV